MRRSVELLANAVVHDVRYRQKGAWQQIDPDELTRQSLRYLYRIIVLLFAEARPELGILPVDDPDYQAGYSLARLRDTALTDLHSDNARTARTSNSRWRSLRSRQRGYEPPATLHTDARGLSFAGTGFEALLRRCLSTARSGQSRRRDASAGHRESCFTREKRGGSARPSPTQRWVSISLVLCTRV